MGTTQGRGGLVNWMPSGVCLRGGDWSGGRCVKITQIFEGSEAMSVAPDEVKSVRAGK